MHPCKETEGRVLFNAKRRIRTQIVRIRLGFLVCIPRTANLSARDPWLPDGGAGRPNGLTEGVWFDEW